MAYIHGIHDLPKVKIFSNLVAGGTIAQDLTAWNTSLSTIASTTWLGQSFTSLLSDAISSVSFKMNSPGTAISGSVYCKIYSDSAGNPGTLIGTSDAINSATISTSFTPAVVTFPFSINPLLTSSSTYYAIVDFSGVTFPGGSNVNVMANNTNPYAGGKAYVTSNSGGIWSNFPTYDFYFDIQSTGGGYIVPSNLKYFKLKMVGGGGGSGASTACGGGGAGGYVEAVFKGIPTGTLIPYSIGAGGAVNSNGGTTSMGGIVNLSCSGGQTGSGVGGAPASAVGGFGGSVTGTITSDMIVITGAKGGTGFGTGGIGYMGYGGSSPLYGGGGANGSYPNSNGTGQSAGTGYGSGGGAGYSAGTAGSQGVIIIEEYY